VRSRTPRLPAVGTGPGARRRSAAPRAAADFIRAAHRFFVFAGLVLAVACLYWASVVFIPIVVAVLLSFLLSPLVARVQYAGLSRGLAVALVVAFALGAALALGWGLMSQVSTFADDLPRYSRTITRKISDLQRVSKGGALEKVEDTAKDVLKQIDKGSPAAERPVPVVVSSPNPLWHLPSLAKHTTTACMIIVLVFFMLIQQRELRARVIRLFGYDRMATTTRLLDEAGSRISRYLLMQTLINSCFGLGIGLGLFLIGLPFALALGCMAAVLRFLPYVGAWLAAMIPLALSLAVFDNWTKPLLILGLFLVTELAVAYVIEPLLYGRSVGVSAIALLAGAGFWTWLWGAVGLALAVPLTVCLVVASRAVAGLEFIEVLLSDDPPVEPHLVFYQRLLAGDAADAADLVAETARSTSLAAAFDRIIAPALARARQDRETEQLTQEEFVRVLTVIRDIIEKTPMSPTGAAPEPTPAAAARVAGCPARDEVDALGLAMLARLLEPAGFELRIAPAGGLVGEALALMETEAPALVCVGAVGVAGRGRMRHIVKRLRMSQPDTAILATRWGAGTGPAVRADLTAAGADDIATSLAEARAEVLRRLGAPPEPDASGLDERAGQPLAHTAKEATP
jgi:predicted PurR-regulated permease PerM